MLHAPLAWHLRQTRLNATPLEQLTDGDSVALRSGTDCYSRLGVDQLAARAEPAAVAVVFVAFADDDRRARPLRWGVAP